MRVDGDAKIVNFTVTKADTDEETEEEGDEDTAAPVGEENPEE